MCGIVAVLSRPPERPAPAPAEVLGLLDHGVTAAAAAAAALDIDGLGRAVASLEGADALLRGAPGVRSLIDHPDLSSAVAERAATARAEAEAVERLLQDGSVPVDRIEALNALVVRLKDVTWALERDRLEHARRVEALAPTSVTDHGLRAYASIEIALNSLDRLEVRGRDSAGIHLLVTGHGLDLRAPDVADALAPRLGDAMFTSNAARVPDGQLAFVYKAAAEIGEFGDNVRVLRTAIASDDVLHRALASPTVEVVVLAHTRWASVGLISEANAHPLNQEEVDRDGPYVAAALNGDVDNYAELKEEEGLRIAAEVTTDAKVIPTLVSRRLGAGDDASEAFRTTVARFDGSVAIGAVTAAAPHTVLLAQRGSGQALYVGLAEDSYVVASEPYGLVEETARFVRLDGETPAPSGVSGQIAVLDASAAGTLEGIRRLAYDGSELRVTEADVQFAQITTRDIDRGGFRHFLLKEITQSPDSVRKTLAGKIVEGANGRLTVRLGDEAFPPAIAARLRSGAITRVITIGQGTAAIAAQSVAASIEAVTGGRLLVSSTPASELSGFDLADDMNDTLIVPISQSGTTTDTNRTVDLVRARGAAVLSIVNRRNSDLVERSDGVLYTSDGRDVEMAVPSTKAFYMQVAAGFLLAEAVAAAVGEIDEARSHGILEALRALPAAMRGVLAKREQIAEIAGRLAPSKRYWTVVGNGSNAIAGREVRIKLSELCYKTIPIDPPEDRKHLDLAAEPLILVCAAGLDGAVADDLAKEVAIYRAHKAAPIVIATEGDARYAAALAVIEVPPVHPALAFVLSAMAGHVFGYEAALAIDAQARVLREARAVIEAAVAGGATDEVLDVVSQDLEPLVRRYFDDLRAGSYDGQLEASTAVRLSSLLRYATQMLPLDAFELEYGKLASPTVVIEDLTESLTRAIDDLTRTIDTIRHQAKTVTVGISRSEDVLLDVPLVAAALSAGAPREQIGYRALRTLAALDPALAEVTGFTRYRIDGFLHDGSARLSITDRGGVSLDIPSRTSVDAALRGTKHRAAEEREVTVAKGRRDGRSLILVPEYKDGEPTGLTLLHVDFVPTLPAATMEGVLRGYRGRWSALVDAVTETDAFRPEVLEEIETAELLTAPVLVLAERWRNGG